MNSCAECGRNLQNEKYYCDPCLGKLIKDYILPIKPTYLNDKWCQDLFPTLIFENMSNYFRKDIALFDRNQENNQRKRRKG